MQKRADSWMRPMARSFRIGACFLGVAGATSAALPGCLSEKVKKDPYADRVFAEFDPGADKPVLPAPTDLAWDPIAGRVDIPDSVADTEAEKQLFAYFRQLDGYPPESLPWMTFSGDIDDATLLNSIFLFDMNGVDAPPSFAASYDAAAHRLLLAPGAPFTAGHGYGVVVRSGSGSGVRDKAGRPVLASPAFYLVRGDKSLVTCKDLASPTCQAVSDVIPAKSKDPTRARAERRDAAIALEKVRLDLLPLYERAKDKGVPRAEIVLAWTFHVSTMPTARFDPASKAEVPIPFPNDLVRNPTTGKLEVPINPSDPDPVKVIKVKLASLDGFSTTAPIRAGVDLPILPAAGGGSPSPQKLASETLVEGFLLAPALVPADKADFLPVWETESLSIVARLRRALRSRTLYFGALTSRITTTDGKPLRAPLIVALLRMTEPVWNKDTGKSQIRGLPDDVAAQAEMGRVALYGAYSLAEAMLKVPREDMAVLFPFTTQTVSEVLADLRDLPAKAAYATTATVKTIDPKTDPKLADPYNLGYYFKSVEAIVEGDLDTPLLLDGIGGFRADWTMPRPERIRYILTVPTCKPAGTTKAPVAIALHALTGFHRHVLGIAEPFAQQCWAVLGFDLPLHGDRGICFTDGDCESGTCDPMTAKCTGKGGFRKFDDGNPVTSGRAFINPADLFATRDNFRQAVIDMAQIVRVLRAADGPGGAGGVAIDGSRISIVGVSMGGMIAALAAAALPEPESVVFSTTAADLIDVLSQSKTYGPMIAAQLAMYGLPPGTRGYREFDVVARWVMDVGEPMNYAELVTARPLPGVPAKKVIVQMAGMDVVMPNVFTKLLADLLGTTLDRTTFDTAQHEALYNIYDPGWDAMARQAAGFVASGGTTIP